jgi:4-amino-4-deoxy-L-arabinose transferase-like glycosyltransferase
MKELKSRVYIIATLLLSALILSPSLHFGFGIDQGVFGYMAWLLLDGQWPYMASWDVNFPGIVFIHALVIFLGGPSMLAFRIFDVLIQLCNVTMIHTLTRRYAGPPAGLVAAIIYALLYISSDFWHTGQRDGYTITCLLLATMTYLRFSDKGRLLMLFFSGLSLGFAFLLRPNGILFLLVFIILLLSEGHRPRDILKHCATIGIAFALPVVLVILTYALIGGLYNLWETLVLFNGKVYSQFRTPTIYAKSIVPLLSFLIFPYFLMRFLNI